jgi:hypothetical protein
LDPDGDDVPARQFKHVAAVVAAVVVEYLPAAQATHNEPDSEYVPARQFTQSVEVSNPLTTLKGWEALLHLPAPTIVYARTLALT